MLDFLLSFYYLYLNSKILIYRGAKDTLLFLRIVRNSRNFFSTIVREGVKTYGRLWGFDPFHLYKKAPLHKGLNSESWGEKLTLILYSITIRRRLEPYALKSTRPATRIPHLRRMLQRSLPGFARSP